MDHPEQLLQPEPQALAVSLRRRVRKRRQELHVADQMRQTKLNTNVALSHESPVRREIIAADRALEIATQQIHQHVGTAMRIDLEDRVQVRPQTPRPP